MSLKWIALLTVFVFVDIYGMSAAERKPENIWPSTAPQETGNVGEEKATSSKPGDKQVLRISNVSTPTLQFYPAPKDKNTGTTIVVCPGGGYNILAFDLEGTEVCEWLNTIGVNAVLLKYRVPRRAGLPPYHAPLQDAQRTLSITRTRAK